MTSRSHFHFSHVVEVTICFAFARSAEGDCELGDRNFEAPWGASINYVIWGGVGHSAEKLRSIYTENKLRGR